MKLKTRGATANRMARKFAPLRKEAMSEAGHRIHSDLTPKRFTPAGASELQYSGRTRAYRRRKKRLHGHNNPMEFTGRSKRESKRASIVNTSKGVRVRYRFRNIRTRRLILEFSRISKREEQFLGKNFDRDLQSGIDRLEQRSAFISENI